MFRHRRAEWPEGRDARPGNGAAGTSRVMLVQASILQCTQRWWSAGYVALGMSARDPLTRCRYACTGRTWILPAEQTTCPVGKAIGTRKLTTIGVLTPGRTTRMLAAVSQGRRMSSPPMLM